MNKHEYILEAINEGLKQSFVIDDETIETENDSIFLLDKIAVKNGKEQYDDFIKLKTIELNKLVENMLTVEDYNNIVKLYKKYGVRYKVPKDSTYLLAKIIKQTIKIAGNNCNLNWIDVSGMWTLMEIFWGSKFNGDISEWDVSNITDMQHMFHDSAFNGDLSKWDTSNLKTASYMFFNSRFSGDISIWNIKHLQYVDYMFFKSDADFDISKWKLKDIKLAERFLNDKLKRKYEMLSVTNISFKPK